MIVSTLVQKAKFVLANVQSVPVPGKQNVEQFHFLVQLRQCVKAASVPNHELVLFVVPELPTWL